jgi:hypothetical protein
MLPERLEFKWIDLDDELSTAMGRSMLAFATAANQLIDKGVFGPNEMRQQIMASGLITIPLPEEMPEEELKKITDFQEKANERPGLLGRPVNPSSGGRGEVMESDAITRSLGNMLDPDNIYLDKLISVASEHIIPDTSENGGEFLETRSLEIDDFWKEIYEQIPELADANMEIGKSKVFDLIDWCDFPVEQILSQWRDTAKLLSDDAEVQTEFLNKLIDILLDAELSIRSKIADAVAIHLGSRSVDESYSIMYNIRETLAEIHRHMSEEIANSIANLMMEYKNDES